MKRLELIEVCRERDEVSRVLRAVELHQVRLAEWVGPVASPADFSESLLEFSIGPDDLVSRKVYQDSGSSSRCGGCTRIGRFHLLEGLSGRVWDESSDAVFVEYPDAGHCEREEERKRVAMWEERGGVMRLWCGKVWRTIQTGESSGERLRVMNECKSMVVYFCRESKRTLFYL